MFSIEEVLQITGGKLLSGKLDGRVTSVHFDSRELRENSLFIALTGGNRDGHDFLPMAEEAGASAALISHEKMNKNLGEMALILVEDTQQAFQELARIYRQKLSLPIIAITGSNGKTTTKDMLAQLLATKLNVFKTHKNLNNELGVPLSILQIRAEHEVAVLELGMNHAGEIDLLASIAQPTISVITNVGDAHLGHFGSKEKIAQAKAELLPHTDPQMYVLLNGDDPFLLDQADMYPGRKFFFSISSEKDVYASNILTTSQGTQFNLHIADESIPCFLPAFGRYNVANCLPGIFIAYQLGFSLMEIKERISQFTLAEMRFQIIVGPNGSIIVNDAYNASPTSMLLAIHTFAETFPERKKILVLGDILELGELADEIHVSIGEQIQDKEFTLLTLGDKAKHISTIAGGKHCLNKEEMVQALQPYLHQNYALLFKGSRGMRLEEIISLLE